MHSITRNFVYLLVAILMAGGATLATAFIPNIEPWGIGGTFVFSSIFIVYCFWGTGIKNLFFKTWMRACSTLMVLFGSIGAGMIPFFAQLSTTAPDNLATVSTWFGAGFALAGFVVSFALDYPDKKKSKKNSRKKRHSE